MFPKCFPIVSMLDPSWTCIQHWTITLARSPQDFEPQKVSHGKSPPGSTFFLDPAWTFQPFPAGVGCGHGANRCRAQHGGREGGERAWRRPKWTTAPGEYSSGVDIIALKVINHKKKTSKDQQKNYRSPKLFGNSWNSIGFVAPQFGETPSMSTGENFLWTPKE